ncbi:hypothetical protein Tco_1229075 [Tanacetum coccineum]
MKAPKNNDFKEKVNTAKVNNVTTAGTKAVVSAVQGHKENAVKSSACWIWRPTGKVIDHISKDSRSYMPKRFDYGNPQYALQDQGIFNSGCSRHMTGNKSYLTDYQDIDGGFVAFAGSPKGGKITGKGKIRTGKLDFEDVYFVKELKFNLFSVSQMCDKKNSVLFTETECLILSPDFKFKKVEGYHAVPPPYTGNYMPSKPDLSFARLDDSVYNTNVSETITSVLRNESTASKSSKDNLEQPKDVRPSAPIIKEWESDNKNTRKYVIEQHTNRQAENLRKSQSPKVDKRNWNGLMTQKLRDGFEFNKKACFVCESLNHLIKDCNFYENKMVGKSMLNNMGRVTGQREFRPVWNNAQRVNHQNKLTHPHPKRNFIPTTVLTKSGNVPVNTAKQSSSTAVSNSTARYVNTAASRPTMNGAKPCLNVFHKSHSSVKRTIYQRTAPKNNDFKGKVNTAKVNNVTTAGTKVVVSDVQGHEGNAVKSSAC